MNGSDKLTQEAKKSHNTYWMLHCAMQQRELSRGERNLKMAIEDMLRARCDYMAIMYRQASEKARESESESPGPNPAPSSGDQESPESG